MSKWMRKGDKVVVVAGNEKGRTGVILRKKDDRVVVQGVNIHKKHARRTEKAQRPTIVEIEVPIHISNVRLCDDQDKPIRVRSRVVKGEKELYYLQDKKEVVLRSVRKTGK